MPDSDLKLHDGTATSHQQFLEDPESLCSTVSWDDNTDKVKWVYKVQDTPGRCLLYLGNLIMCKCIQCLQAQQCMLSSEPGTGMVTACACMTLACQCTQHVAQCPYLCIRSTLVTASAELVANLHMLYHYEQHVAHRQHCIPCHCFALVQGMETI